MSFNSRKISNCVIVFTLYLSPYVLQAKKINLVTTSPDLAWAARQIGGIHVDVKSLLTGKEDPHYVDALPNYISIVSQADAICIIGMGLEVGWIPKVLSKSGNTDVQPGGKGYCEVGKSVNAIERPTLGQVDRSHGDVHAEGNPHFWLGPKAMTEASSAIVNVLTKLDMPHASYYQKNYANLKTLLAKIKTELSERLKPLQGTKSPVVIQFHKEFSYFFKEFNIKSLGSIEDKPGVPPAAGRIAEIGLEAKAQKITVALAKPNDPEGILRKFSSISGVPVKRVSPSLMTGKVEDYSELLNHIADQLLSATPSKKEF